MKFIPLDSVLAEIDKRLGMLVPYSPFDKGGMVELQVLKDKLNYLEVKEVDLEEELKHYCNNYYNCDYPKQLEEENCSEVMPHIVSAAKHFFELGLNTSNPLTWEDIKLIWTIGDEIPYMPEEEFFKELLKQFKAQKGK